MPECPKCGTSLKDDFGMVKCTNCEALLFVDWDGNAFIGTEQSDSTSVASVSKLHPVAAHVPTQAADQVPNRLPDQVFNHLPDSTTDQAQHNNQFVDQFIDLTAQPTIDSQSNPPRDSKINPPNDPAMESLGSLDEYQEQMLTPVEPSTSHADYSQEPGLDLGPEDDPLGLSAYSNSEASQGKDGPFLFTVLISGIDTKEMRNSIREAIEDSRFGWDASHILRQINNGTLTIESLAPVKAVILINRIKRLPVKIRWEQHAITQMDSN